MKNTIFKISSIAMLCIAMNTTKAQTLVAPTATDNYWVTGGITGINTALIDIIDSNSDNMNYPYKQLAACAYDDAGSGGGGVVVTDFRSGCQVNTVYTSGGFSGYHMVSVPDVIIGNKSGSRMDFIMAVAYVGYNPTTFATDVQIDYFDITYTSWFIFTVNYNSSETLPVPALHVPMSTVHIDVVAKSSSLTPYNLPYCDRFFVTYDAQSPSLQDKIIATYGSLNAYTALLSGPRSINVGCGYAQDAHMPDVAGIERNVPFVGLRDIACLTWVTGGGLWPNGNVYLYYNEWDPAAGAGCAAVTAFTALGGPGSLPWPTYTHYNRPRIDANDDYWSNGTTGLCQSKVVAEVLNGFSGIGANDVGIYNYNVTGGLSSTPWIDVNPLEYPVGSGMYPFASSGYNHFAPAVAYGQNAGSEYMVTQCTNESSYGDFFVMSPIGSACSSGVAGSNYYVFNTAYPAISSNYANAVSTPVNMVWDTSLVAWTHDGDIYYKRSGYGYAYKQSPDKQSAATSSIALHIAPNPATETITVYDQGNTADRYVIKNMIGQKIGTGNIDNTTTPINITNLASGSYIISFFNGGKPAGNHLFVKQ